MMKNISYFNICQAQSASQKHYNIPDKKRNAPLRTVQLPGRSQWICQFSLYQCKGM